MSTYDDWRTETDRDYEDRMGVHQAPSEPVAGGTCACGASTLRSMAGVGFQCHQCAQAAFHQLFQRAVRQAS